MANEINEFHIAMQTIPWNHSKAVTIPESIGLTNEQAREIFEKLVLWSMTDPAVHNTSTLLERAIKEFGTSPPMLVLALWTAAGIDFQQRLHDGQFKRGKHF